MARRACLAIGVSTVTPLDNQGMRFGFLDGAAIAARKIGEWALRSGFGEGNVRIVTDEPAGAQGNPVTRERVQKAVDELFPQGHEAVEHLILAFCGHGLTDANIGAISWLFSDSDRLKYRVIATEFYAELLLLGIQRITLITDACREAPKDLSLMRLESTRGITVQGNARVKSPRFDRFAACQDGQLGYMVSEPNSANPGKCVFSGVIADALWGQEPTAFDDKNIITTATFGACIRERTAQRAKDYWLELNPECTVDPVPQVLFDKAQPPKGPPDLQPWPTTGTPAKMGTAAAPAASDAERNLELVHTDKSFRKRILGPNFGADIERHDLAPSERLRIPDASKDVLHDLVTLRTSPAGRRGRKQVEKALVTRLQAEAIADARKRAAGHAHRSMAQVKPARGQKASNVIVFGQDMKVWADNAIAPGRKTAARTGFRVVSHAQGTPVLVELPDGSFAPVVPHDAMYVLVWPNKSGQVVQAYGASGVRGAFKGALGAIADFSAGRISAEQIDELAGRLRYGSHVDPVLGAICAHLYRATADFDSIRRLAYFYVKHKQPVPFDIALLGGMRVTRRADGIPLLHIPSVSARKEWKGNPKPPAAVTAETSATKAWIAGRCPWLGLGWDYVGLARPDWETLVADLVPHASQIHRSGFTVLPNGVGLALAKSWGLERR